MSNPLPILRGDYPDPTLVRVGGDYYLTHSTNIYAPSLLIWHSTNLADWNPVGSALNTYDGDVWAPDISFHNGRFAIYYTTSGRNKVIHAAQAAGPWTEPVDLHVPHIDPGYVYGDPAQCGGTDGRQYLFLSGGHLAELTAEGTALAGAVTQVYNGWPIPADWRLEGIAEESPKLFWRDGWCYLVTAQGGTAGPSTSHMAVVARARSVFGPWENAPDSPLLHTPSREARWYSAGHATLFDTPEGDWWMIYHAYDKGYWTLGRHTLIERIAWTSDGWPTLAETPALNVTVPALSDDFSGPRLGWQWRFARELNRERFAVGGGVLHLRGEELLPSQGGHPLCVLPGDRAYSAEVEVEIPDDGTEAGLLLFYSTGCLCGLGLRADGIVWKHHDHCLPVIRRPLRRATLRLVNDQQEVDFWVQIAGEPWQKLPLGLEVSGWQHNTLGGFLGLRIGLYAAGSGTASFRRFQYAPLPAGAAPDF